MQTFPYKKIIFTYLLICFGFLLNASNTDSLINELTNKPDAEQLGILLQISKNYRSSNLDTILHYNKQAIAMAKSLDSVNAHGLALNYNGIICYVMGDIKASMLAFDQAIKLFTMVNNNIQIANCYNNKSTLYLQKGEIPKAINALENALNMYKESGKEELTSTPLINMGRLYFRTGDYQLAEQLLLQAIQISKQYDNKQREIEASLNIAAVYSDRGEYLKALEFYNNVISMCDETNDLRTKSAAYANIGDIYYEIGNTNNAIEYINQALDIKRNIKLENKIPHLLNQLGHIYADNHMHEMATNLFSDALTLAQEYENKLEIGYALSGLGQVYENTEIYTKALDYYSESLKIFEQINSKKEIASTNVSMGRIYALKLNDFTRAKDYFNTAERILSQVEHKNGIAALYFTLGQCYYEENDLQTAIYYLNNSIKLVPKNKTELFSCHQLSAEIHIKLSQYKSATEHYKKALQIKDSLVSNSFHLRNIQFELEYQKQKKEQEITNLIRQSELNTLLLAKKRNMQYLFITIIILLIIIIALGLFLYRKLKAVNADLISQQDEIEAQKKNLQEKNVQLHEANITANKLSDFKSQFLANISHEIRTPLNAIAGYSKLLAGNLQNENNTYHINQVLQSTENLMIIINDLLDFSKIEAGKMVLEKINFNPVKIITNAISTLKFKAEEKNIQLEIHIDPFIPKTIKGDPYRLSQILINLIGNAIKFSNDGQVVTIEARCENNDSKCNLTFAITDHGVGIAEKKLATIFDSFTQVQSDTARLYEGTGLGLSIVKRLIELQKGQINVKSKVKKGSVFTFSINYKIVDEMVPKSKEQKTQTNTKSLDKTHYILLVEDNAINQELAKDTIASWDEPFIVDVAENGKDAIIALQEKEYSAILMDIQMPVMDGHEATQYIRNSLPEPKCHTPIIGMTAHAMTSEKDIAIKNGMNEYLTKPFNPEELKQKLIYFVLKKEK